MSEELGKIERLPVDSYKKGRKLFFVPLIYLSKELPLEYLDKYHRYWDQVGKQLEDLTSKLGVANRIYHELVAESGEKGTETLKQMNESSYHVVMACLEKKAQFDGGEDYDALTEYMDWSRCLMIGLQNAGVINRVYESYLEAAKKRNEAIARKIDETLKSDEIGLIFLREGYQIQFPSDIQVFYIAPPALDDIKRWLREHQTEIERELEKETPNEEDNSKKGVDNGA